MSDLIFTLTLNKQCNGIALLALSFPNLHQANATTRYYFAHQEIIIQSRKSVSCALWMPQSGNSWWELYRCSMRGKSETYSIFLELGQTIYVLLNWDWNYWCCCTSIHSEGGLYIIYSIISWLWLPFGESSKELCLKYWIIFEWDAFHCYFPIHPYSILPF